MSEGLIDNLTIVTICNGRIKKLSAGSFVPENGDGKNVVYNNIELTTMGATVTVKCRDREEFDRLTRGLKVGDVVTAFGEGAMPSKNCPTVSFLQKFYVKGVDRLGSEDPATAAGNSPSLQAYPGPAAAPPRRAAA